MTVLSVDEFLNEFPAKKSISSLEQRLGLAPSFCSELLNEQDWSFIIKLSALCESSITKSVGSAIENAVAREFIEDRGFREKIGLYKKLFGDSEIAAFAGALSQVRNAFAHDPSYVSKTIEEFIAKKDPPEQAQLIQKLCFSTFPESLGGEELKDAVQEHLRDIKRCIWMNGICALTLVELEGEVKESERERDRLLVEFAQHIRREIRSGRLVRRKDVRD